MITAAIWMALLGWALDAVSNECSDRGVRTLARDSGLGLLVSAAIFATIAVNR